MSSAYRLAKSFYRRIVPEALGPFLFGGRNPLSRAALALKTRMERGAGHDDLYDEVYFARQARRMRGPAAAIAESVVTRLPHVRSVVDVGCGSGAILLALRDRGVAGVGLEYADAALAICRRSGLDAPKFDIEATDAPALRADLVLSTEVAEHLPAERAERYVDRLVGLADTVLMTAAPPGQGGTDHVNEQPDEYWIEKFAARGWRYDPAIAQAWRVDWRGRGVQPNRCRSVMQFDRG